MKIGTTCFFLLFTLYFSFANIWEGDYYIQSQEDVDAFPGICNCTLIEGSLIIIGNNVVNLDSLNNLEEVTEAFKIINTTQLNNIDGLNNVIKIGGELRINNNSALIELIGFENLQHIKGDHFQIKANANLTGIKGFGNLFKVSVIQIESNPKLKQFTLFKKLEHFQQLTLSKNKSLTTIRELDVFTEINSFYVTDNNKLERIDGFNMVTLANEISIENNPTLQIINGFKHLQNVKDNLKLMLPESMVNINNFENLREVENYFISNITHFERLDYVGIIDVSNDNYNIDTFTGPSGLKKIGRLEIQNNDLLKSIKGFGSLEEINSIRIYDNKKLQIIDGFESLEIIADDCTLNKSI